MAEQKIKQHGSTRNYHLKRRYGLTEQEVEALSRKHGELCLICLHRRSLHVDHDHATGEVRGLLCFSCNGALGQFKDDAAVMRRAVDYLEGRLVEPYRPEARTRGRSRGGSKSHRHYHLTGRYGIGADEVDRMIDRQGGLCLICRTAATAHIDHDHVTGVVRGVLCGDCNSGMGQLRDDPWVVRRAIEYLTGGLSGLSLTGDGGYEVAVVRPRRSEGVVDPGWELGRACTDDLALLHAMAEGDSEDPWETDVMVASAEPSESRFPPLDLRDPGFPDLEALPREPLGPPEYVLTSAH
ncbi:endonuclease VII domain-containing protein [Actinoallomurus vinaceus]